MKALLKIIFASAILAWLVSTGKLDLSLVKQSMAHPHLWAGALLLLSVQAIIAGYRWKILLKTKSRETLSTIHIIKVNWIGLFFSVFLPGIVTGDLFKLLYIRDVDRSLDKTFLVMSTVLDRALGLSGLVILMGVFSVFNYRELVSLGPGMEEILLFDAAIFLCVILFLSTLFLPPVVTNAIVRAGREDSPARPALLQTLADLWAIGSDKKAVFTCLSLSIFVQFLHVAAFWIITSPFYEKPLSFSWAFSIIPLGDIAVAIPIAPAGLGVGHAAFETLFAHIGIQGGANLFNLYFMATIIIYLMGIVPTSCWAKSTPSKRPNGFKSILSTRRFFAQ